MKYKASLRYRVTLAFTLLGISISLALAIIFYTITINIEKQIIAETLSTELEDYISRYNKDIFSPSPKSTLIDTFVSEKNDKKTPKPIRNLKTGLHHIQFNKKQYYAEVKENNNTRFIMLYDDKDIRYREDLLKLFLVIGVIGMALFSAVLGFWLAKRITSPVYELANRVRDLNPEQYQTPIAKDFPDDEVGELAKDFDMYIQRLSDFIEREQAFTSDVSHELRTPLTIIEGATDILLSNASLDIKIKPPIERIARSTHNMTEIVSSLLLLARENDDEVIEYNCDVEEVIKKVVNDNQHLLLHKPVEICVNIQSNISLSTECTLLRIVLANLFRNAIFYTDQGKITIDLNEQGISIKDTGKGIPEEQRQKIFDQHYSNSPKGEGIGLSLVRRICNKYHWKIEIDSTIGQGSIFKLFF